MSKDEKLKALVEKCVNFVSLTVEDLELANAVPMSQMIVENDFLTAERVQYHLRHEFYRLRAQNQFTKLDGFVDRQVPYKKTVPLPESKKKKQILR